LPLEIVGATDTGLCNERWVNPVPDTDVGTAVWGGSIVGMGGAAIVGCWAGARDERDSISSGVRISNLGMVTLAAVRLGGNAFGKSGCSTLLLAIRG
jgi:hypothetical protein